jgi:hypothetical protein
MPFLDRFEEALHPDFPLTQLPRLPGHLAARRSAGHNGSRSLLQSNASRANLHGAPPASRPMSV